MSIRSPRAAALLGRGLSTLAIVALSVTATLLVTRLTAPPAADAQAGQVASVRASEFTLVDATGAPRAALRMTTDDRPALIFFDTGGATRNFVGEAGIQVLDTDGRTVRFAAGMQNPTNPGVSIQAADGTVRLALGVGPSGAAALTALAGPGQTRMFLGVTPRGEPVLQLLDDVGLPVVSLPDPR